LCEALGIDGSFDGAYLMRAPASLLSRESRPQIVRGLWIGISKGCEFQRSYGQKGSAFLSRKFPD